MIRAGLPRFGRFAAWREAARQLASNRVDAAQVTWADEGAAAELFGADPLPPAGPHPVTATKDFLGLAQTAASHSDPERWALLYAALIRLQEAAKAAGANAVTDITSYYKKNEWSDPSRYECHAGALMAGVALKGKLVILK